MLSTLRRGEEGIIRASSSLHEQVSDTSAKREGLMTGTMAGLAERTCESCGVTDVGSDVFYIKA